MEIFGMEFSVTWMILIGMVTMIAWYDWWCHQYFQRLGIPVASYVPIFGNILQWRHGFHSTFAEFTKKYGKVYGMYDFRRPILIISDPVILKDIFVKNFASFTNRRQLPVSQKPLDKALTVLEFKEWKDVRNVISPSFSVSKMRMMFPMINDCCDKLVANFKKVQEAGESAECRQLFGAFSMDAIARCGFGLEVDSQQDKDDPFVKNARRAVDFSFFNPTIVIASIFPVLGPVFDYFNLGFFDAEASKFFTDVTTAAVKLRKEEGKSASKRIDMLQLMLNAHTDTEMDDETTNSAEAGNEGAYHRKILTADEVMSQAIIFFLAGFETTHSLLCFVVHTLALNQDVQEKLHAEIVNSASTPDSISYDVIMKLPYLDMVINETLRLFPPGNIFDRICNETVKYDGLTIEKGVCVMVVAWTIHRNEEYWPNPTKFDPERFSAENKASIQPCTFLPFGFGPRNCIGMRFAMLQIKLALVRVVQQFRFEVCPETQIPLKLQNTILAPKKFYVGAVSRN